MGDMLGQGGGGGELIGADRPDRPGLRFGHTGQHEEGQLEPSGEQAAPLILTLAFDPVAQARFDRLRTEHFPPARNLIPAHLTLFHHLPGHQRPSVQEALSERCGRQPAFPVAVTGLRSLGRGVAFTLVSPELAAFRAGLAAIWAEWLTPQDRQGFRPHVTVQNKVEPAAAKALLHRLQAGFAPASVRAEGVVLWRYLGGPWEAARRYSFASTAGCPASTPPSITSV